MTNTLLPAKFTGIIQLAFEEEKSLKEIQGILLKMHPSHQPIKKLHITLLHQSFPKRIGVGKVRGDKLLKALYESGDHFSIEVPAISFGNAYIASQGDRKSTYVVIKEQQLLLDTRDKILKAVNISPEELQIDGEEASRIFHVSLTNLTGNGGDSIAYPNLSIDRLALEEV